MYSLKPVFDFSNQKISLPTCMYELKPLYQIQFQNSSSLSSSSSTPLSSSFFSSSLPEEIKLQKILERQDNLISKLKNLISPNQFSSPCSASVLHNSQPEKPHSSNKTIKDLVISCNPDKPPFSLFLFHSILSRHHSLLIQSFLHSSAKDLSESKNKKDFQKLQTLISPSPHPFQRNQYDFVITYIWKRDFSSTFPCSSPSLVVSPGNQVPICGEINILKYISRLFGCYDNQNINISQENRNLNKYQFKQNNNHHGNESLKKIKNNNNILNNFIFNSIVDDLLHFVVLHQNSDILSKEDIEKIIEKKLSATGPWLLGDEITIADLVIYCLFISPWQPSFQVAVGNQTKKWLDECKKFFQ